MKTAPAINLLSILSRISSVTRVNATLLLANKLTLNKDKTEYMIAGSKQQINKIENDPEVKLGNCNIKRMRETKTLGVIIDDQLK